MNSIKNRPPLSDNREPDNNIELYKAFFERSSAAIAIFEANAIISLVNDAFCKLSGYSREELIGFKWHDKMPTNEVERIKSYNIKRLNNEADTPEKYETSFYSKDGKLCHALVNASLLEDQKKIIVTFIDITNRREIEDKLQASEEKFRSLVETANDIVFTIDNYGKFTYISPTWEKFLGHDPSEVVGNHFGIFIHPENLPQLLNYFHLHFSSGVRSSGIDYRIKHKDGSWKWHSSSIAPIYGDNGVVTSLIGIAHDITEKKLIEERLAESEFFFKESQRAANIGSYKADFITGYWESSEVLDQIFGIDNTYVRTVAKGWKNIIHPKDLERMSNYLEKEVIGLKKPFNNQYRIVRKNDGETRWVHGLGNVIVNQQGNVIGLIGTIQDITEQKIHEQSIQENSTLLEIALKIAHLGPWQLDVNENLFRFNDTFYALFRTTTEEIGSTTMTPDEYANRFLHPDDRYLVEQVIKIAMESKLQVYNQQLEHRIFYADGKEGFINVRFSRIIEPESNNVKFFGINQDITSIKKAEKELLDREEQLSEMNAMKDKFFSIIAHDLKSPFNSILGLSELLIEEAKGINSPMIQNIANTIFCSSKMSVDLLNDLLEWARSETGRMKYIPENINLLQLALDTKKLFESWIDGKTIQLKIDIQNEIIVFADKEMLSTILRNLISNAIKFTYKDGVVQVSAEANGNEIIIKVKDTGIGIPESRIKKLFRIDETISTEGTNREQGTGLGLILCKEFVEKHGGRIWVESTVNNGSTFYIALSAGVI